MIFIDVHTHHPDNSENCIEVMNVFPWETAQLSESEKKFFSIGLHPWYLEDQNTETHWKTVQQNISQPGVITLGEAGLDKLAKTDWALQRKWFEKQIELSESAGKPLLIHCVKAYSEILSFRKNCKTSQPWIIHGFNTSLQLAMDLIENGCYLSVGAMLLKDNSKITRILNQLPLDKLFFETDNNTDIHIKQLYDIVSKKMNRTVSEICQSVVKNFQHVFPDIIPRFTDE